MRLLKVVFMLIIAGFWFVGCENTATPTATTAADISIEGSWQERFDGNPEDPQLLANMQTSQSAAGGLDKVLKTATIQFTKNTYTVVVQTDCYANEAIVFSEETTASGKYEKLGSAILFTDDLGNMEEYESAFEGNTLYITYSTHGNVFNCNVFSRPTLALPWGSDTEREAGIFARLD